MKTEFNMTKMVEEIVMQAKENQEEFIFETIHPYCENILQMKINKEELKQILLNSIQKQQPCEDCISRAYIEPIIEELENICVNGDEHILDLLADIKNAPPVTPSYNSVKTELKPCEDCISREEALRIAKSYYHAEYVVDRIRQLPSVTPKAELWSRLYIWLNDMYLGISPDEFTPDDERRSREAQTDIIEDIIEWIDANVFEQKPKEDEE